MSREEEQQKKKTGKKINSRIDDKYMPGDDGSATAAAKYKHGRYESNAKGMP